jgi:aryl-alcohol dehydrogenase-like predicted oxidoreductase
MNYRSLGRTGLKVSEIGFGAWGIGGRTDGHTSYGDTDDATSVAALRRAFELGITFFDTSSVYGYGRSESLIGEALGPARDKVVIATKAGYARWDQAPDFSPAAVTASLEASLRRLGTDYVDVLQLHNPGVQALSDRPLVEALQGLVRNGRVRTWGASMRSPGEALLALQATSIPVLQVNLNMLDVRALDCGLMQAAEARGIGLIARTPLCFGFLSGAIREDTVFPPGDHRAGWPPAQTRRWIEGARDVLAAARASAGTPTQTALRFCLSFPQVSTVIPGMLTPAEAQENAEASTLGALSPGAVDAVLAINRSREFFVRA